MTYQILTATTEGSLTSDDPVPVGIGTDYAEWQQWRAANPNVDEQLIQDDLAELGIVLDDSNQS